jgi:hypothetical protein
VPPRESASTGETMSNDLLPLPDILAEPPRPVGFERAAADVAANGHGSGAILTHYASLDSHPEMNGAAGPFVGADAATHNDSPAHVPTPLADGLADVAVTIRQIESILQANGMLAPEVHFSVERIHDVAMALRMREVDGALCDTLEASVREVGDAIVRNDAAAARALSAAALLYDLARRIDQMVGQAPAAPRELAEFGRSAAIEKSEDQAARSNGATSGPMALAVVGLMSDDDYAGSLLLPAFGPPVLPEVRDWAEAKDDAVDPTESPKRPIAGPVAEQEPAPAGDNRDAAAPATILPAEAPNAAIEIVAAQSDSTPVAVSPPPTDIRVADAAISAPAPTKSSLSPDDPLAALYGLSEEELIALFS